MPNIARWDDPELTVKVAWAMGVEAAAVKAGAKKGRLNRPARYSDFYMALIARNEEPSPIASRTLLLERLFRNFYNGWQAERSEMLEEHIAQTLSNAMHHACIEAGPTERVFEEFTERLNLDGWFVGASE